LIILSQLTLQTLPLDQRRQATWFLLLGIALFLVAATSIVTGREHPSTIEKHIQRIAGWFHIESWQLMLLLLSPAFSWLAWRAAGEGDLMLDPIVATVAWLLAIAAAVLGSFKFPWRGRKLESRWWVVPLLLTLIAFLVRGWATDRFPIVLTGDEGSAGIEAARVLKGELNNPFVVTGYSFPSLYYLLQSVSIRLFGQTTAALRLPSALAGALTVTALFYVGRLMFDRRTGLLAAAFLAAYNFHINFSRIGLNNIWDGLWYTIFIGALWHGWEYEKNRSFTVAGLALGVAQHFYPSGRALIIPILGWLFLMGLMNWQKFKRIFPGIVIMFLVATVIVLPLAIYYFHHPDEFAAPFQRVTIFGYILEGMVQSTGQPVWLILLNQVWLGLQAFVYRPITFWYQSGTPLLRPLAASLFLIGLLLLLIRARDSRFLLLALWILTFGLIGGFSESTPAAQRYVAAAPVCALLVGYGLSKLTSILEGFWPQLSRALSGVAIALMALIAVDELNFYFNVYTPRTVIEWSHSNNVRAQHLADYLKDKPSDLQVVFMGAPYMGYRSIPSIQYLAPHIQGIDVSLPWEAFDKSAITGRKLVFVMLPGNEVALSAIQQDYPGGQTHTEMASDGNPLYWYYEYNSR
jgi:hypothetical protein